MALGRKSKGEIVELRNEQGEIEVSDEEDRADLLRAGCKERPFA